MSRRAFSFVEVLACVLVLSMGIAAAIGMVLYGMQIAKTAISRSTALPTAMSVATDPSPIVPAISDWPTTFADDMAGYVNGYYVVRHEAPEAVESVLPAGFSAATVRVEVYETLKGRQVATFSQRIIRQGAP